jgi:hypothetical protein
LLQHPETRLSWSPSSSLDRSICFYYILCSGRNINHHRPFTHLRLLHHPTILSVPHNRRRSTPSILQCLHTTACKCLRALDLHQRSLCQRLRDKDDQTTTSPRAHSLFIFPSDTSTAAVSRTEGPHSHPLPGQTDHWFPTSIIHWPTPTRRTRLVWPDQSAIFERPLHPHLSISSRL